MVFAMVAIRIDKKKGEGNIWRKALWSCGSLLDVYKALKSHLYVCIQKRTCGEGWNQWCYGCLFLSAHGNPPCQGESLLFFFKKGAIKENDRDLLSRNPSLKCSLEKSISVLTNILIWNLSDRGKENSLHPRTDQRGCRIRSVWEENNGTLEDRKR